MRHPAPLVALGVLLWLVSAPPACAEALFEWREPGRTVAYSQTPTLPRDGVLLRGLRIADLPVLDRMTAERLAADSASADDGRAETCRRDDSGVATALVRLQAAEREVRQGQQPRAAERRHLANGHSRLSRRHLDRLSTSGAEVASARDALQSAYAQRDALAKPR